FFQGKNTSGLGGLRQGISFSPNDYIRPVDSAVGWARLTLRATSRLSFNIYGGLEDDSKSHLCFACIAKNQTYASNIMYRLRSNVLASFEAAQTRTIYIGTG